MVQPPQRGRHERGIVLLAQALQHLQRVEDRLVPEATPARKKAEIAIAGVQFLSLTK